MFVLIQFDLNLKADRCPIARLFVTPEKVGVVISENGNGRKLVVLNISKCLPNLKFKNPSVSGYKEFEFKITVIPVERNVAVRQLDSLINASI